MNWKDELAEEMGYTICPICFPEYVYCDEDCEHCKEYIEFKQAIEEKEKNRNVYRKKIDDFWQARIDQTRNLIDDYNRLQIEAGKLESISGFSIESLIKMFAEGYELKK